MIKMRKELSRTTTEITRSNLTQMVSDELRIEPLSQLRQRHNSRSSIVNQRVTIIVIVVIVIVSIAIAIFIEGPIRTAKSMEKMAGTNLT